MATAPQVGGDSRRALRSPWFILAVVAVLATLWMLRYDVQRIGQKPPVAYVLDRWTGSVSVCGGTACSELR